MQMWIDVEIFAPLDHALQDADETLEAFRPDAAELVWRGANLEGLTTSSYFWDDVDESLEDVGGREVAVVVDVDVHDHLKQGDHLLGWT